MRRVRWIVGFFMVCAGLCGSASAGAAQFLWSAPFTNLTNPFGVSLVGVDCPSLTQCTGVGSADDHQSTWQMSASASAVSLLIDGSGGLNGPGAQDLSCPTTQQCTTVDQTGNEVTFRPSARTKPPRTKIEGGLPNAIACPTARQCTVVDSDDSETTFDPQSPQHPTHAGIDTTIMSGVACPSVSQCTAVDQSGYEITFDPQAPSTAQRVQVDTNSAGEDLPPELMAISCPATSQCTAVDGSGFEVTFNPSAPAGAKPAPLARGALLTGVNCPTASQCTAVDADGGELTFDPTAPGTVTQVVVTRGNQTSGAAVLRSVVCPAVDECVAASESNIWVGLPIRATTHKPSHVRAARATVGGAVETGGQSVTWHFQYGRTTGYGKLTAGHRLTSTHSSAPVSSGLTGLKPHTVYHVRLIATTTAAAGAPAVTAYGHDQKFTTPG